MHLYGEICKCCSCGQQDSQGGEAFFCKSCLMDEILYIEVSTYINIPLLVIRKGMSALVYA